MKSSLETSPMAKSSRGEGSCWTVAMRATLAFIAIIFLAYITVGF